ncbi:MAG: peptidase S8 [Deltaproteobacteria bacterium]|nr:peptidase S8 [Deltaproteobacteria bacterium]
MRVKSLLLVVFLIFLNASEIRASDYVPGEILVKYKPGIYSNNLQGELSKIGWAKIKIARSKTTNQATIELKKDPDIIHVEPNYYGEFLSEPNDPDYDQQWYLPNIEAPDAWDISLGKDVIIALVDSGVDLDHEDLVDNILPDGWDFGNDDDDPNDEYGHGTQVCGVIAAIQNNNLGISGIAPESKILPLKISESGVPIASAVAEAILYASDHGAKIINLSLQLGGDPQVVTDAVDYAVTNGVLLVAAAGQDPGGPVRFPANLENVMAVSAADDTNGLWFNSNYGPEIELTAPGEDIYTTKLGGGHITSSGTSLSAPMVSAVAALIISSHPRFSGEQIRERLITTADDLGDPGWDQYFGHGKVNALKSVKSYPCSAEKIYGEDSEEVVILRYLRDNILSKSVEGRETIRLYYRWNPVIVRAIKNDKGFKKDMREMIDGILSLIKD